MAQLDPLDECSRCDEADKSVCRAVSGVKLSDYRPGQKGVILRVCGRPDFRLRLMEMGLTKGAEVRLVKEAPLADPLELVIKGYHLSLRREEAADLVMSPPEDASPESPGLRRRLRRGWGRRAGKRFTA
jgi:Fe2+ transport system protein FeoA